MTVKKPTMSQPLGSGDTENQNHVESSVRSQSQDEQIEDVAKKGW